MVILYALGFVILTSAMNAVRGSGKVKKIITYLVYAAIATVIMYFSGISAYWMYGVALLPIMWGCNSFGWGDFFPHGQKSNTGDFPPARWIADKFCDENKETIKWQIIAMSFRFFLTFGAVGIPIMCAIEQKWLGLMLAPLFLASGILYRIPFMFRRTVYTLRNAEIINGLLIGLLFAAIMFN